MIDIADWIMDHVVVNIGGVRFNVRVAEREHGAEQKSVKFWILTLIMSPMAFSKK